MKAAPYEQQRAIVARCHAKLLMAQAEKADDPTIRDLLVARASLQALLAERIESLLRSSKAHLAGASRAPA